MHDCHIPLAFIIKVTAATHDDLIQADTLSATEGMFSVKYMYMCIFKTLKEKKPMKHVNCRNATLHFQSCVCVCVCVCVLEEVHMFYQQYICHCLQVMTTA